MTALAEITVTRRCELCDIPLEYVLDEWRLEFAGHSAELCRVGTLEPCCMDFDHRPGEQKVE